MRLGGLIAASIRRFARRLRFPYLFGLTVIVLGVDVFVPDLIPFADEILLGLSASVLAGLRKKGPQTPSAPIASATGRITDEMDRLP